MGISMGAGEAASKVEPAYLAIDIDIELSASEDVEGVTVEPAVSTVILLLLLLLVLVLCLVGVDTGTFAASSGAQLIERWLGDVVQVGVEIEIETASLSAHVVDDAEETEDDVEQVGSLALRVLRAHMAAGVSRSDFCGCAFAAALGGVTGSVGVVFVVVVDEDTLECSWTATCWGSTKTPLTLSHFLTATMVGCCAPDVVRVCVCVCVSGFSSEFVSREPGTKKGTKGRMDAAVLVAGAMLL